VEEAAASNIVSIPTVYRWKRRRFITGSLERAPVAGGQTSSVSADMGVAIILYLVAFPSAFLKHVSQFVFFLFGGPVLSTQVIRRFLRHANFSKKRLHTIATEFDPLRVWIWWNYRAPLGCWSANALNGGH
jgi:transposase